MKLVIKIFVLLCLMIGGKFCKADSWTPPSVLIKFSENQKYLAYVEPTSELRPKPILKVFEVNEPNLSDKQYDVNNIKENYLSTFWANQVKKWEEKRKIKFQWNVNLSNMIEPLGVFISDDGKYVVTLDNWGGIGKGDDVIAFYGKKGQIKKYSLEEALSIRMENELDWGKKFPVSTMSIHWNENCIVFLRYIENKLLFCIWLELEQDWLAFDAEKGNKININNKLEEKIKQIARISCLKSIKEPYNYPYNTITASCLFLGRTRIPEDRKVIESVLSDKYFGTGSLPNGNTRISFSESIFRNAADMALSIWDKKIPDDTKYKFGEDIKYNYLGVFKGTVILPEKPNEKSVIWIYLLPEGISANQLSANDIVQDLSESFESYFFLNWTVSESFLFEFRGVTPGKYWIKAIYVVRRPDDYSTNKKYMPQKGDFANAKSDVFEVKAGQTIDVGMINCDSLVKE